MNIDDQLRHYDPARYIPEGLGQTPRAIALLDRITTDGPAVEGSAVSLRSVRRKRVARYSLAAVVASAGVVFAPVLATGDAAIANWDATPRPVTGQEAARDAQSCAAFTKVSLERTPGGYKTKIVEARGTWTMAYLASADSEAQCLLTSELTPAKSNFQVGNFAQSGPLTATPAADALATTGVVYRTAPDTATQYMVAGKVGSQVTGVVFEAQGALVQATVKDGVFTAWWPQRKPSTIFGRALEHLGYNGSTNPEVQITLNNGALITKHVKDYDIIR